MPDDVRLKLYNQALRRFMTVSSQLKEDQPVQATNYWIDNQAARTVKRKADVDVKSEERKSKPAKKRKAVVSAVPARRSARPHVKWSPW
jgi:hypothetical protein